MLPGNYDPYVTWNVYKDNDVNGDMLWHAEAGHYFSSIVEAVEDYKDRGGK